MKSSTLRRFIYEVAFHARFVAALGAGFCAGLGVEQMFKGCP